MSILENYKVATPCVYYNLLQARETVWENSKLSIVDSTLAYGRSFINLQILLNYSLFLHQTIQTPLHITHFVC